MKIMTIVGTRPEIIRLSRIIPLLDKYVEHILVHTGQNYDKQLSEVFFDEMKIRYPDHFLHVAGRNSAEIIANVIDSVDRVLELRKPDAVLVLGDTNSALSVIAAKRRRIPIFHMEAGNRCFDERVPEEINRRIVDHTADINMPYSDIAREYLLREGLSPDRIIKTGSPMKEVIDYYKDQILNSYVFGGELEDFASKRYMVASFHREENVDNEKNLNKIVVILNDLVLEYDTPIVVSTHPRTMKRISERQTRIEPFPQIRFMHPFGYFDYMYLQMNAQLSISDSGTITEESAILGFPAINLREAHERPEGMEEGIVPMTGLNSERVLECADIQMNRGYIPEIPKDYNVPVVAEKVLNVIMSYTDYINKKIYYK